MFAAVFKVYCTISARRFTSDLCDAQAKGFIDKVPHFNSVLNYLESPDLYPILLDLIERTASRSNPLSRNSRWIRVTRDSHQFPGITIIR